MVELTIKGGETVELSEKTFDRPFSESLVHQVITAFMAGGRAGTKAQKNRAAVRGGGKKPWRQKGTGNARAGTIRSPIWRGGGRAFAASTRSFDQKVNRKMYRAAIQSILSELRRQDRLVLVNSFSIESGKTKDFVVQAKELGLVKGLIVIETPDVNTILAARNIPGVAVVDVEAIDPVSLVGADQVIMTVESAKKFEEWLG